MLRLPCDDSNRESSSSASKEELGDKKDALAVECCRRKSGLFAEDCSWRGTCEANFRPKRADDGAIHRVMENGDEVGEMR